MQCCWMNCIVSICFLRNHSKGLFSYRLVDGATVAPDMGVGTLLFLKLLCNVTMHSGMWVFIMKYYKTMVCFDIKSNIQIQRNLTTYLFIYNNFLTL